MLIDTLPAMMPSLISTFSMSLSRLSHADGRYMLPFRHAISPSPHDFRFSSPRFFFRRFILILCFLHTSPFSMSLFACFRRHASIAAAVARHPPPFTATRFRDYPTYTIFISFFAMMLRRRFSSYARHLHATISRRHFDVIFSPATAPFAFDARKMMLMFTSAARVQALQHIRVAGFDDY